MSRAKKRPFRRKERALATRRRMLLAAYRLFCAQGYAGTTMEAIAAEAGVAVQTLYFTFHKKGAILNETLGASIAGFDRWMGPPREPFPSAEKLALLTDWWPAFASEPDAERALAILVERGTSALHRGGALIDASHGCSDPDVRDVFELAERRRVSTFRMVVRALARKRGGLRRGLGSKRATDILLVIFSGSFYHALHTGRGWAHGACRRFLLGILREQLLHSQPPAVAPSTIEPMQLAATISSVTSGP